MSAAAPTWSISLMSATSPAPFCWPWIASTATARSISSPANAPCPCANSPASSPPTSASPRGSASPSDPCRPSAPLRSPLRPPADQSAALPPAGGFLYQGPLLQRRQGRAELGFIPAQSPQDEIRDILADYRRRGWLWRPSADESRPESLADGADRPRIPRRARPAGQPAHPPLVRHLLRLQPPLRHVSQRGSPARRKRHDVPGSVPPRDRPGPPPCFRHLSAPPRRTAPQPAPARHDPVRPRQGIRCRFIPTAPC